MVAFRVWLTRLLVLMALIVPATAYAQVASVSIALALTSGTPIAGTNLEFTLTASNEGPDPAANAVLLFDVPTNSSFVSLVSPGGWSCVAPSPGGTGTITCSIASLGVGSDSFVLTVATVATSPQGTPVTLAATITSTTADPDPQDNINTLTVLLVWQANLAVTKSGPSNAFAGAVIVYTISINNPGPSPAADLDVSDTFATPLRFVSVTAPGWTCATPPVGSPGTVNCTNPEIPAGTTNLTVRLDTPPSTLPASVTNDLSVGASSDPGGPRLASSTTQLTASADLTITKSSVPATPVAGQPVTYTITVNQNGPSDAANVVLTDPLPAAVQFQAITAAGWTCSTPAVGSGGTVTCTRTPLPSGVYTITIQGILPASTPAGTNIGNTASVTSGTPDPTLPNTATASAVVATQADLTIAKSSTPAIPVAGQSLTYTITVTQNGPSDAVNVVLTDPLPAAVRFQAITAAGWTCGTPAVGSSGTVSCTRALLVAGSYTITIQGFVPASTPAGTIVGNTASVTSDTPDPTLPNTATASAAALTQADLTITKSVTPAAPVAGQSLTYTITVTQNGPSDASNVVLTDPLPAAVQFQAIIAVGWICSTPAVGASGTVNCTRAPLPPGVYTITIQGTLPASTPSGTTLSNTASVTSDTPDPTLPNTATANAVVATQADLSITIADFPDPVVRGTNLTYQLVVTNGGPSDAINPSLSVLLDPLLGFAAVTPPAGWTCTTPAIGATGTIACSAAAIPAGASATFTIVATVPIGLNLGAAGSVVVTTSATVSANTPDSNPANNSATATTVVIDSRVIPTLSYLALVAMFGMLALFAMLRLRGLRSPNRPRRSV